MSNFDSRKWNKYKENVSTRKVYIWVYPHIRKFRSRKSVNIRCDGLYELYYTYWLPWISGFCPHIGSQKGADWSILVIPPASVIQVDCAAPISLNPSLQLYWHWEWSEMSPAMDPWSLRLGHSKWPLAMGMGAAHIFWQNGIPCSQFTVPSITSSMHEFSAVSD